ncbi:ASCH domain-containing protein [Microbacterium resistens]|uniref:ASCH domain-containing protein n=1 Tax=Microbacterium resistens TaxID=156977 RepID=UPI0022F090D8|nr:ASCH domain-containing protein [Streptomyces sp. MS2A]
MASHEDLPLSEYAFPGPLRDLLVGAILAGDKTTTTFLVREIEVGVETMPTVGERFSVIDSDGRHVGIETIEEVRLARIADIDLEHAIGEGEGYTTVAEWRTAHEGFWHGEQYRAFIGDPEFRIDDDTMAVLVRFGFEPAGAIVPAGPSPVSG